MNINIKEIIYLLFVRFPMIMKGKIRKNLVYMHWGRGLNNFGDCMQPYIAKHYKMTPVYASSQKKTDIILQGTVLQWIPRDYSGIIAGAGSDAGEYVFPDADVAGVRGQLTLENVKSISKPPVLGDPGLLMPMVFPCRKTFEYELGIIPHFVDKGDRRISSLIKNNSEVSVLLIDVFSSPKDVCKQINRCKYIFSSSLHGLIVADAYDIPNLRFSIKSNRNRHPKSFYDYKFCDYYSSFKKEKLNNHDCIELCGDERFKDFMFMFSSNHAQIVPIMDRLEAMLGKAFQKIKQSQTR